MCERTIDVCALFFDEGEGRVSCLVRAATQEGHLYPMLAATNFEHAMNYSYLAASPLGSTADQAPRAGPSESLLFLQALRYERKRLREKLHALCSLSATAGIACGPPHRRAAGALRNFFVENASFSPRDLCSKAKEESMKAFEVEDGNKRRLEERIRPFQLFVNEDTDNTGDCQYARAEQESCTRTHNARVFGRFDSAADQLRLLPGNAHLTKELVRQTVIDWLRRNPNYRLRSRSLLARGGFFFFFFW